MFHYVYMLISINTKKYLSYVGYSLDPVKRLRLHNKGKGAKFTRGKQWKVLYKERYYTKREALSREYYIKKNRKFRNLIRESNK